MTPQASILHDGDIPILTGLDGDLWASQLLTLQPLRPGITTMFAFDFEGVPDYMGVTRVEVAMFNCPEWGIAIQSISLSEASNVIQVGTRVAAVSPAVTSCNSLVRTCIAHTSFQPVLKMEFQVSPGSDWVHVAEVTFYNEGRTCPPDTVITEAVTLTVDDRATTEHVPTLVDPTTVQGSQQLVFHLRF